MNSQLITRCACLALGSTLLLSLAIVIPGTATSSEPQLTPRIIGGAEVTGQKKQAWPWRSADWPGTSFLYGTNGSLPLGCSGQLVERRWVLTAAHCVQASNDLDVIVGRYNLSNPKLGQVFDVGSFDGRQANIFLHPRWNSKTGANDLALIRLPKASSESAIKLASRSPSRGQSLAMAGYGMKTQPINGAFPLLARQLQAAPTALLPSSKCQPSLGGVDRSAYCVQKAKSAICFGDSGGPLVSGRGARAKVIGVAARTETGKCSPGSRGWFAKVPAAGKWLRKTIRQGRSEGNVLSIKAQSNLQYWRLELRTNQPPVDYSDCIRDQKCPQTSVRFSSKVCAAGNPRLCWRPNEKQFIDTRSGGPFGGRSTYYSQVTPGVCFRGRVRVPFYRRGGNQIVEKFFRLCP